MKPSSRISLDKSQCCGCGVCEKICPKNAITMCEDVEGFVYPVIDEEKCVECGLCLKKCAFNARKTCENIYQDTEKWAYAGRLLNEAVEKESASGGIFAGAAYRFMKDGGWVCGSVADFEDNKAWIHHIISQNPQDIRRMQGSKYVQSDISGILEPLKKILGEGGQVLFCGTPCQVDAIRKYTGNPESLYTIDIICHGVPSQKMFNDYLQVTTKASEKIISFLFRDKRHGKGYVSSKTVESKKKQRTIYRPAHLISFYHYFLKSIIARENCYSCPYTMEHRVSDMTIGDYWGILKRHPELVEEGEYKWSCILANTSKGKKLLEMFQTDLKLVPSTYEKIAMANEQLKHPSQKHVMRNEVLQSYVEGGYQEVEKRFRKRLGIKYYYLMIRNILFKY